MNRHQSYILDTTDLYAFEEKVSDIGAKTLFRKPPSRGGDGGPSEVVAKIQADEYQHRALQILLKDAGISFRLKDQSGR
jgi:hypothetical protein